MFIRFELFDMYVLTLVVHSLYIAGDRTKMVGNRSSRQVLSVYQRLRPPDGGEGTSLPPAARAGLGRPNTGRGRGRGRGCPRRDLPPPPALDQPEDPSPTPEEHVAATGTTTDTLSGDEGTQQMEDSSALSAPYLRGPTSLPPVPLPDRHPLVRPVGRR